MCGLVSESARTNKNPRPGAMTTRALLRCALAAAAAATIHAASCPATLSSPSWTAGNSTGLALSVDAATGCFTVAVAGEVWLASSHLLLSAGGVVYREPQNPGHHKLAPSGSPRKFTGADALGRFEAVSITWVAAEAGKEPAWVTTFRAYTNPEGAMRKVVFEQVRFPPLCSRVFSHRSLIVFSLFLPFLSFSHTFLTPRAAAGVRHSRH